MCTFEFFGLATLCCSWWFLPRGRFFGAKRHMSLLENARVHPRAQTVGCTLADVWTCIFPAVFSQVSRSGSPCLRVRPRTLLVVECSECLEDLLSCNVSAHPWCCFVDTTSSVHMVGPSNLCLSHGPVARTRFSLVSRGVPRFLFLCTKVCVAPADA